MLRTALRSTTPLYHFVSPAVFSASPLRFHSNMSHNDKVVHVHSSAEYDAALKKPGLVVVDFSATWCGPCKMIAPKFAEFSNKFTNATFIHVDVDEVNDHPHVQAVSGVPHFKFFKDGTLITEFSGANVPQLQKSIEQNA